MFFFRFKNVLLQNLYDLLIPNLLIDLFVKLVFQIINLGLMVWDFFLKSFLQLPLFN